MVGRLVDVTVPRAGALTGAARARSTSPALVGRGDGLTPYGDDVLCGWLAVHRAAGWRRPRSTRRSGRLAHTTTLLSATLLDCAMHGEVIPEFAAWLAALGTDDEEPRAAALARVGHTSGRGLLEGARPALLRDLERRERHDARTWSSGKGAYADSVTLLQVSRTVQGVDGVAAAQVAMATALNIEVLTEMGFEVPAEATTNDMVVAVRLAEGGSLDDGAGRAWSGR